MSNLLFVMSLSGSTAFLLYRGLYRLVRTYCRPIWRYRFLKVILVFYLFPVPLLWDKFRETLRNYGLWSGSKHQLSSLWKDYIVMDQDSFALSPGLSVLFGISTCAILVAMILAGFTTYQYRKEKRQCLQNEHPLSGDLSQVGLTTFAMRRDVEFLVSERAETPFVIGLWKPIVVLPSDMLEQMDVQIFALCTRHELTHVRHHDLLYRFLALLVVCLHWFNPLCYWLKKEITVVSEICCDQEVLEGASSRQIKAYFRTMIAQAQEKTDHSSLPFRDKLFASLSGGSNQEIRRRLQEVEVMKIPKKSVLAVLSGLLVVAAGTISAMAYEPPSLYDVRSLGEAAEKQFQKETNFHPEPGYYEELFEPLPFDCFFTDEEGNVYELLPEKQSQRTCNHNFQSGTITTHSKTSDGGCVVRFYHADRCTKCGMSIPGDCFQKLTFEVCPH